MTPEQYNLERLLITESALRVVLDILCATSPAIAPNIRKMGLAWDQALDRLEKANAASGAADQNKESK